jgi:hypothetical protein
MHFIYIEREVSSDGTEFYHIKGSTSGKIVLKKMQKNDILDVYPTSYYHADKRALPVGRSDYQVLKKTVDRYFKKRNAGYTDVLKMTKLYKETGLLEVALSIVESSEIEDHESSDDEFES